MCDQIEGTWETWANLLSSSLSPPLPYMFPALSSTRATVHPTFPSGCCTWCGLMHVTWQAMSSKMPTSSSSQRWMCSTGTAKETPSVSSTWFLDQTKYVNTSRAVKNNNGSRNDAYWHTERGSEIDSHGHSWCTCTQCWPLVIRSCHLLSPIAQRFQFYLRSTRSALISLETFWRRLAIVCTKGTASQQCEECQ